MTRLSCHRFRANEVRLWLSLIAYNLGNLWRRLALPARFGNWSLTSLQQRLVKTGGRLDKARPLLLVAAGGEPSDAAAVWRHAAEDCDAAGASRIGGPQSAADFDDEMGEGEVSAESIGQTPFLGVASPREAKPTDPGAV